MKSANVVTAKTSGQKVVAASQQNKKPTLHDVRVEDIHSESGLQQPSPNKISAPGPNSSINKLSSPSIGKHNSALHQSGKVSPLKASPTPSQKPAISIQEDEGGESSSY